VVQNPTRAAKYVVRWQRADKAKVLTNDPIYRVTSKTPEKI